MASIAVRRNLRLLLEQPANSGLNVTFRTLTKERKNAISFSCASIFPSKGFTIFLSLRFLKYFIKIPIPQFLKCSYFLRNLSLNIMINMVLMKTKVCKTKRKFKPDCQKERSLPQRSYFKSKKAVYMAA